MIQLEKIPCNNCSSLRLKVIFHSKSWCRLSNNTSVELVQCLDCGLIFLSPRPVIADIFQFYENGYTCYRPAIEDEKSSLLQLFRQVKQKNRRIFIEKLSQRNRGNILDIGCATGIFLHEMQNNGWNSFGIEPNDFAANYAINRFNLKIFRGYSEDANYPTEYFDVISLWDVFEHLYNPVSELERSVSWLKKGGGVLINIPNLDSVEKSVFGKVWHGWDPPGHLFSFTREVLGNITQKVGLRIVAAECIDTSFFSWAFSVGRYCHEYIPSVEKPVKKLLDIPGVRFLFEPVLTPLNWMGLGSTIAYYAVKE